MRLGVILSLGLHMLVVAMTWFGLPHLRRDPPLLDDIIFVKITEIAEVTNVPPVSESKKPKQKQIAKPKVPRNKPKVPILQKKRTLKKEQIIPKANKKSPETVPKPRRKKEDSVLAEISKPKKKPSRSREKSQAKKKLKPSERPMKKKFTSLLKDLKEEKLNRSDSTKSLADRLKEASRNRNNQSFKPKEKVTIGEIDLVRQQISQCWNITSGARQADALSVEIEMKMNPDATVRQASVVDSIRMNSDPYYRAAAESALRALSHPDCIPLKLPLDKYYMWKSFTFNFDPKNMLQ